MSCLEKPWEAAFDPQVNAAGWRATGPTPFTRRIEKKLLADIGNRAVSGDLLVHPSVQEHPGSLVSAMCPAQPVGVLPFGQAKTHVRIPQFSGPRARTCRSFIFGRVNARLQILHFRAGERALADA